MPDAIHDKSQYANNPAEQSHESTRVNAFAEWSRAVAQTQLLDSSETEKLIFQYQQN
jgi:hypothetical protein